jgi:hypothetical protein
VKQQDRRAARRQQQLRDHCGDLVGMANQSLALRHALFKQKRNKRDYAGNLQRFANEHGL